MDKMFKSAPLPFVGQKRQFFPHFKQILTDNIPNDGEGWTIVDAFGGSGLLSHWAKRLKPKARMIFNDFDGYAERINHIADINRLRRLIEPFVADTPKDKQIAPERKAQIVQVIQAFDGFICPRILSSWLMFSARQVENLDELFNATFYDRVRRSDYPNAIGYLEGVEVVSESFERLLPQFKQDKKALFVLDPPYLCTKQAAYEMDSYFDLIDFLKLINLMRPPYIMFSSTKSEFIKFIDYLIEEKGRNWQTFEQYQKISLQAKIGKGVSYEDNVVFKF